MTGHDRFLDDDVTWTLAGGRIDGPDVGMGGLGGHGPRRAPSTGVGMGVPDHSQSLTTAGPRQ